MKIIHYFAFGSNMFARRLCMRVPSTKAIGTYTLSAHDLRFHKRSGKDGSGKCDAYFTGDQNDTVIGRLFTIAADEELKLDEIEGLSKGYEKKDVCVFDANGEAKTAFIYYANCKFIDKKLRPFTWYKQHVIAGAKEGGLPPDYITRIESVEATPDPDSNREKNEMELHVTQHAHDNK